MGEDSPWQRDPEFLSWPKKCAAEVTAHARKNINRLQKKAFTGVLKDQAEKDLGNTARKPPFCQVIRNLVKFRKFDQFDVVAWIYGAAKNG